MSTLKNEDAFATDWWNMALEVGAFLLIQCDSDDFAWLLRPTICVRDVNPPVVGIVQNMGNPSLHPTDPTLVLQFKDSKRIIYT